MKSAAAVSLVLIALFLASGICAIFVSADSLSGGAWPMFHGDLLHSGDFKFAGAADKSDPMDF